MPFLAATPPTERRGAALPRAAWLDLGAAQISPENEPRDPVEVLLVESGPSMVRVAVRGAQARYALWVRRVDLLGVLTSTAAIPLPPGPTPPGAAERPYATLHPGAAVEVLERKGERARVRYSGMVELEAWIPAGALGEQGEVQTELRPLFTGRRLYQATPGLAIRAEPRWGSPLLAVLARGYFVEEVRALGEAWSEVEYRDGAVSVHGFASRRDPPERLRARGEPPVAPSFVATATLPAEVCLFAAPNGEAIGVTVAAGGAIIDDSERDDWHAVTLDSPWSPLRFFARRARGAWQPCESAP